MFTEIGISSILFIVPVKFFIFGRNRGESGDLGGAK